MRQALILASILLALAGCNSSPPPVIVVGHVSDKTRRDKAGDQAELGIRLALHDLTKDGALAETFGGRKIQVQHTDTQGKTDSFESQAVRLFSINRCVALLGGLSAEEVTALDHVKAPVLTFHGEPIAGASNQVFYLGMSATKQGEILAKIVAENAKVRRIVFVQDERRSEGAPLADAFQKTLAEGRKNGKAEPPTVVTVRFGKDVVWHEVTERMLTPPPQVVVFAGAADDFNTWQRSCRRAYSLGDIEILFAGNDGDHRLFELGGDTKTSVLLATAFHADPASPKIAAFRKTYAEKFHLDADVHAALAYDGMRMLVEAMKRTATQLTSEKLRDDMLKKLGEELLSTKDFDGLTGPLTITPERQVKRTLFAVRWQNGSLALVKAFP